MQKSNQRDKMRELVLNYPNDRDAAIRFYAQAERDGVVVRRSNNYKISPENYAARLYADGIKKGWIHE